MKNLTITQKLEQLFQEMLDYLSSCGETSKSFDESHKLLTDQTLRNLLFKKAILMAEFNNLPTIVSDEKYESLPAIDFRYVGIKFKQKELYRGSKVADHHANLLCDKDYHLGVGDVSNGIYVTPNYDAALAYTRREPLDSLVLKIKLPNANVIDDISISTDLSRVVDGLRAFNSEKQDEFIQIKKFFENIKNPYDSELFSFMLFDDLGIVATLLKYDALYDHNFPSIAIFNREKIVVSESEYVRICKASPSHAYLVTQPETN